MPYPKIEVAEADVQRCPTCRRRLEAATWHEAQGATAEPKRGIKAGDLFVCIGCSALLRFVDPVHVEAVTPLQLALLPKPVIAQVQAIRRSIAAFRQQAVSDDRAAKARWN